MFKFLFELRDSHLLQYNDDFGFILKIMMKDFINSINKTNTEEHYYDILVNSIYSGGIDIIKLLLDNHKIDINTKFEGVSLLHLAAMFNKVEIAKFLIDKIDINTLDIQKHTPLMYAIKNHSNEIINFLLHQPKIDINCQDIFSFFNFVFLIYCFFMQFELFFNGIFIFIYLFSSSSLFNYRKQYNNF